jgi:wyosine [tRNA(Phe)-imidazoG37] synthetase (radical SAM superfamily)
MSLVPLLDGVVYGPVQSRRLGASLGVNLLPPGEKICNFNCPYCQYGWSRRESVSARWPSASAVAGALAEALETLDRAGGRIDRITIAGHGEPTLHPDFCALAEAIVETRDRVAPDVRTAALSNSSTLDLPGVRAGLSVLDERYMKLDAGDEATLRRLNASPVPLARILDELRRLPDLVVQSMFVSNRSARIDNTGPDAVGAWLQAVASVRPLAVHLYTLDRSPAWPFLSPVPAARLRQIARDVSALGIPASVF